MASASPPIEKIKTPNFLDQLESSLIKRKVSIIEFAESKDFCNKNADAPLYPRQKTLLKIIFLEDLDDYDHKVIDEWEYSSKHGGEVIICPGLRERIEYLKGEGFPHFRQIVLVGGRRSSKSHLIGLMVAYKLYNLTLMDNVGRHFNIDPDKDIYFSVLGGSTEQTKATVFSDTRNWIWECKPLENLINKTLAESISVYTPYDKQRVLKMEAAQGKIDADLAKLKVKAFGTNSRTLRGQASMVLCLDEFAHYMAGESRYSDEEIYKAAIPSLRQFKKDALIIASSSPYTKIGKFFELYNDSMELDPPDVGVPLYPDMFMLQFPSWELYKDWETDSKFSGAIVVDPKFDPSFKREEDANPESFKVEYRSQFAETENAFLNPEMVDRMFDPEFTKGKLGHYISTQWGATGFTMYKAHGDPSSTTANFGVAIAHVEQVEEEILDVNGDPTGSTMMAPHVVFDLVDAFYPEDFPGHTIDWMEVLPRLEQYANAFRPFEFTFDQFDSTYPIQRMRADLANMGITEVMVAEKVATQFRNYQRAMNFKAALNLGRIHVPHPTYPLEQTNKKSLELVKDELKFLVEKNGRVDKQDIAPVKTKDIADCYDDKTEILTYDGWKYFKDITKEDIVATRNKDGNLEFHHPINIIKQYYNGEMVKYETNRLNFCVTPNHNMLVGSRHTRDLKFELIKVKDLVNKEYIIPKTININKLYKENLAMAKLVGFWLSDGRKLTPIGQGNQVRITQTKINGINWMDQLSLELDFPISRKTRLNGETEWIITSKELREYLIQYQNTNELCLVPEVFMWPYKSQEALLEGLMVGDGAWSDQQKRYIGFYNTSYRLVNDVQRLLIYMGLNGRIKKVRNKGQKTSIINNKQLISTKDLWYVHVDKKENALLKTKYFKKEQYSGYVYCLTVPNNTLMIRRNGIAIWCGNCLMECVDALIGDSIMNIAMTDAKPEFGAAGGYSIGGRTTKESPFSEYYEGKQQTIFQVPVTSGGRFLGRNRRKRF